MRYMSLFLLQLVSISATIGTTIILSDEPAEHAQYQEWNIGVESKNVLPLWNDLIGLFYEKYQESVTVY